MRWSWLLIALAALPGAAAAAWHADGVKLVPGPGHYEGVSLAPDGAGGVFALCPIARYQDVPGAGYSFALQHVRGDGTIAAGWPAAGVPVDTAVGGYYGRLASDGAGGALVAWRALRAGKSEVLAQHVLGDGSLAPGWPFGGAVAVDRFASNALPDVVPDGAGGAFVSWQDSRNGYNNLQDPYVQHLGADGAPAFGWPVNGVPLTTAAQDQYDPVLAQDGAGGVIAAWWDYRDSTVTNFDIYAQHLAPDGSAAPGWAADGTPVCRAAHGQFYPSICSDGAGGAVIAWADLRASISIGDVYAQRVLAGGTIAPGWATDGRKVGALPSAATPAIVPDGAHGAFIVWREGVPAVLGVPIPAPRPARVSHLTASGALAAGWPAGGLVVFGGRIGFDAPRLVADGAGGVIVTSWDGGGVVLAQRLAADGTPDPRWPAGGVTFTPPSFASGGGSAPDGAGGVFVSWQSPPDASGYTDVRLQRITGAGVIAPGWDGYPDRALLAAPSPNPAAGAVAVPFALPAPASATLRVFDLGGAAVRTVFRAQPYAAGQHVTGWDGRDDDGHLVRPGIYLVRIEASGFSDARRVAIVR